MLRQRRTVAKIIKRTSQRERLRSHRAILLTPKYHWQRHRSTVSNDKRGILDQDWLILDTNIGTTTRERGNGVDATSAFRFQRLLTLARDWTRGPLWIWPTFGRREYTLAGEPDIWMVELEAVTGIGPEGAEGQSSAGFNRFRTVVVAASRNSSIWIG